MKHLVIASGLMLALSGCVAAGPYPASGPDYAVPGYAEPYPGYYGGSAAEYYPYSYYYGSFGAYPAHRDYHRRYNWGYWRGDGQWHGGGREGARGGATHGGGEHAGGGEHGGGHR